MTRQIAVAGAGIGGLTVSLALARAGFAVTLLEKRTAFSEVGAGLQLSPNASRILIDLGLKGALARHVVAPRQLLIQRWGEDAPLHRGDLAGAESRYGAPYWVIGRRALQTVLVDAMRATPAITLKVGREVTGATEASGGVAITVQTAGGKAETLDAEALIGADGLWSQTRRLLHRSEPPAYTGYTAWRALVPLAGALPAVSLWMGRGCHAVHYPIDGGERGNLVVITREPTSHEGWDHLASPPARLAEGASPALQRLIRAAEGWGSWSLFSRQVGTMARGRIALLGDAAHPVLPFMAQGAALAIEDAAVLARLLANAEPATLPSTLARYDALRRPRAARVRETGIRNGRTYHLPGPLAWARDQVIRRLPADGLMARHDWLYGWRDEA